GVSDGSNCGHAMKVLKRTSDIERRTSDMGVMGRRFVPALALTIATLAIGGWSEIRYPISDVRRSDSDIRLTVARLQYDGGGDWYANPSSLPNLLTAIRERTSLKVEKSEARVRVTDERLWDFPFLHVTGHGNIRLSEVEVARLRENLLRGGFLHVSDNYGI